MARRGGIGLAVGLALVLALVACSSDGSDVGSSPGPTSTAASTDAAATVRVVSQNLLHGIACADETHRCELAARVELFARQLGQAWCPEVVGLQETNAETVQALREELPKVCDGRYQVVSDDDPSLDREVVLTTGQVIGSRRDRLAGPLRTVLFVRVATDAGLVDLFTTHLASGSDDRPCDATTCPPPCLVTDQVNACQARQVVALAAAQADRRAVVVIAGDLNAAVDEPTIRIIRGAGYADTHREAGEPECDPETGESCTSGRVDDDLSDLRDPTSRQSERIDYVFVGGRRECAPVHPTGLFNAEPAVDGPSGLAFPSDHTGVQAALRCRTTAGDRAAAADAQPPTPTTTTTAPAGADDYAAEAAITAAFNGLFGAAVPDLEQKLALLEDGPALRESFLRTYEATKDLASKIVIRIDGIALIDPTHADVTYTLLIDGTPVLDHLPGAAVQVDGRWLVSKRTYCDVSTQGATEIPPACR